GLPPNAGIGGPKRGLSACRDGTRAFPALLPARTAPPGDEVRQLPGLARVRQLQPRRVAVVPALEEVEAALRGPALEIACIDPVRAGQKRVLRREEPDRRGLLRHRPGRPR